MKMQRLHLLAMEEERQSLMDALLQFGRLEIRQTEDLAADPDWAVLLHPEPAELVRWREASRQMEAALSALGSRGLKKTGLFAPRPRISQSQFLDEAALRQQQALAAEILGHTARKEQLTSQLQRIQAQRLSLEPWAELDVPLELHRSGQLSVIPGTMPLRSDLQQAKNALEEQPAELVQVSLSPQQQYLLLLVHQAAESAVLEVLRPFGFAAASFGTLTGTVQENLQRLDDEEEQTRQDRRAEDAALDALGGRQPELKLGLDRLNLQIQREENRQRLLTDGHIFYLEGWVPEADTARLEQLLEGYSCAWDLRVPTEEEYPEVPVTLKSNWLTRSMTCITEQYSMPAYDGVDPNPVMAPFFILFFGMMMADMGYGLLMIFLPLLYLKKARPPQSKRGFIELILWCGIVTFIFGALTGGFFGDFLTQVVKLTTGGDFTLPALFTPLDDTLMILIGAMALGMVQIITGMAISFVRKLKNGQVMDAVWEELTWWVVFAGIGLMAAGMTSVVLYVGLAMVVLGPVLTNKGFGKITGIFGSLYNHITGYFGDILSYSRLMALMLAGSVIAQVFNTLGAIPGNIIVFLIISLAGNALNFALNLLGCYVHDLRLQCLEYFGKFYEDGGKPFKPLMADTKYVDITK